MKNGVPLGRHFRVCIITGALVE